MHAGLRSTHHAAQHEIKIYVIFIKSISQYARYFICVWVASIGTTKEYRDQIRSIVHCLDSHFGLHRFDVWCDCWVGWSHLRPKTMIFVLFCFLFCFLFAITDADRHTICPCPVHMVDRVRMQRWFKRSYRIDGFEMKIRIACAACNDELPAKLNTVHCIDGLKNQ